MSELHDLPLQGQETPNLAAPVQPRRLPVLLIAVAGLLAGVAGAWWWTQDRRAPAAPPAAARTATDAPVAPAPASVDLPPIGQMDIFLRSLLASLSASPELARWLATDGLIQQMANAIDLVSRGQSPARELSVLKPVGPFETARSGRTVTIDPDSYRRFDGVARAVSSLDANAVANVYRTIHPRLEEAYRGLGRSSLTLDQAVGSALQVLIDTPDVTGPVALMPGPGATLAYADVRLQQLLPAQKQIVRMGPENAARVRETLREIKAAIERPR
jgi:Protein of unknown function (DUF3014)